MKSFYILLLAIALAAVSCRTKDGAPGPAGDNTLTQQGYIKGDFTFVDDSGTTITSNFKYEYYESLSQNKYYVYENGANSNYEIVFSRRAADDSYNYFDLSFAGDNNLLDGTEEDPFYIEQSDLYFVTTSNGQIYEFNGYNTEITNVNLDITTGRLTFDFTSDMSYSNGTTTVSGSADVSLYRVYYSMIAWG